MTRALTLAGVDPALWNRLRAFCALHGIDLASALNRAIERYLADMRD